MSKIGLRDVTTWFIGFKPASSFNSFQNEYVHEPSIESFSFSLPLFLLIFPALWLRATLRYLSLVQATTH